MNKKNQIGKAEMVILHYVQDHHPVSVREVADYMAETNGKARTTVLTVMERLRKKRHLKRAKVDGVYHYSPRIPRKDLMQNLIGSFVDETLGGSLCPFVTYLTEKADLTEDELKELKHLVDALEKK